MKMGTAVSCVEELGRQAQVAEQLGSPFVAAVLAAGQRQLWRAPRTEELIASWRADPAEAALAMRFNAALHFLARRAAPPVLGALYRGEHDDFDGAIGEALAVQDGFVRAFMRDTPQTNEVGRTAALVAALRVVAAQFGMPFDLLEIGSSCGLNLNLGRYYYRLGSQAAGDPESPVRIAPMWRGGEPPAATVTVCSARGVDLNPLDAADPATCERLMAYIWADQPLRARRLEQALAMARQFPTMVEQGDATVWLPRALAEPQAPGYCRVVFHSMVLQYLGARQRAAVTAAIHAAGERATKERPLAWIGYEWTPDRREVQLSLTLFPEGRTRVLATCHAYGNWVDWRG